VESDVCFGAVGLEDDVEGRHVCLECETGRDTGGGTECVVYGAVRTHCELASHCQIAWVWNGSVPEREAVGIPVVASLRGSRGVEKTVVIHLLTGVVLMDIRSIAGDLVDAVFYAVDPSYEGFFCHSDRVTEAPAEQSPFGIEIVGGGRGSEIV